MSSVIFYYLLFFRGGVYIRATFLITSKVYFITLIDLKKMRILNKAGFIFTFTTLSVFQLVKVCIFLFIIVNDIHYMYFATFFICMAKRWHWKHNDKCVLQRFLLACLCITVFYFDFTNIVISVSIKSDLRNFLVSFDHASFGFVYKLAQVSMFNNKCSL